MTLSNTRGPGSSRSPSRWSYRPGRVETVITIVAVGSIALMLALEAVRVEPADAPLVQASFDVAPASDILPRSGESDAGGTAGQPAEGVRPDASH